MSIPLAPGNIATLAPLYYPYQSGNAEFQLGLRPFKQANWLQRDANSVRIMRVKRLRMADASTLYYKALPCSIHAQYELRRRVTSHLVTHSPAEFHSSNGILHSTSDGMTFNLDDADDPLLQLSQMIEEDFMVIQEVD